MIFFKRRGGAGIKKLVQKTAEFVIAEFEYNGISTSVAKAAQAAVGKGSNNTSKNSNFYSNGSDVEGIVAYTFDFSEIPQDAQNISVSCAVKGGRENASKGKIEVTAYVIVSSWASQRGSTISYTATSSSVKTIDVGTVTRAELDTLYLQVAVAYYGGHIDGATMTVTYEVYE